MIEYLASCLIVEKTPVHAIRKYDAYCIIKDRKTLLISTAYGFTEQDTLGFDDYDYGFYDERIYK